MVLGLLCKKKERRGREDTQRVRESASVSLPSRHVNHDGGSSCGRAFMVLGRLRDHTKRSRRNGDGGAGNWWQHHRRASCGRGFGYRRQCDTGVRFVTQLHLCTPTFVRLLPT